MADPGHLRFDLRHVRVLNTSAYAPYPSAYDVHNTAQFLPNGGQRFFDVYRIVRPRSVPYPLYPLDTVVTPSKTAPSEECQVVWDGPV